MEVIGWTIVLSACAIGIVCAAIFIYRLWSEAYDDYQNKLHTWEYNDAVHQQKLRTLGSKETEDKKDE